jgi:GT2 family glycosyltransferase
MRIAEVYSMLEIAVVLTCYNRQEKTIACLDSLYASSYKAGNINLTVYLVDDGSTDGTGETVSRKFPEVNLIRGTGNLYWSGGMRLGFGHAISKRHDFYLWLNDDLVLNNSAIGNLLKCYYKNLSTFGKECIVVGPLSSCSSGDLIYGGIRRIGSNLIPKGQMVYSQFEDLECDYFHGNCVLIPRKVPSLVGNIDPAFIHAMGDHDYGYRCTSKGFKIFVCRDIIACSENDSGNYKLYSNLNQGDWKKLTLLQRLGVICSPKNFPVKPWFIYSYRYLGFFWLLRFLRPYLLAIFMF